MGSVTPNDATPITRGLARPPRLANDLSSLTGGQVAVVIDVFSRPSSLLLHALNHRLVASPTPAPDPVTRDGTAPPPPLTASTYLQVDSDMT